MKQINKNYFEEELYNSLEEKAAAMFYFILKDHSVFKGNKRMAIVVYISYLLENTGKIYLDAHTMENELFHMAGITDVSTSKEKKEIMNMLVDKTKRYLAL